MTPEEIIALARVHFGEATATTVSAVAELNFLNASIKELIEDVPYTRLPNLIGEDTGVTVDGTSGYIARGATWDKLLEVYVDNIPAMGVDKTIINNWDYGTLFQTTIPIFHYDGAYIWVRPFTGVAVDVLYTEEPTEITSVTKANELTEIPARFHTALADLVASHMYAQEEDAQQAGLYRTFYQQKLTGLQEELAAAQEG